jgi:pimeloyl-ACP methyl ester carboxylesterase
MQAAEELRPDRYPVRRARPRGFEQAYVRAGDGGQPLLLVHGWPETSRIWWRNIGPLAEAGFDVIAPDLRGFGLSEAGPDAFGDVVSHSRDLYALLHDELGIERVVAVAGDLGGAVVQDLSQRQPGFIEQLIVFNCPLPYLKGAMDGLRTRRDASALDYYERQGNDPEGLMAELGTPDRCQAYVASFYTERHWASAGAFDAATAAFHSEPFADPARLRETFKVYESALHAEHRIERPLWTRNTTPTRILFGSADGVMSPDFDRMAAAVFLDHGGPTRVPESGHFLQWEAAELLDEVILEFRERSDSREGEEQAFISLGSNLGSREQQLCAALAALRRSEGVRDVVASPVYETAPVGPGEQGLYLPGAAPPHARTLFCSRSARGSRARPRPPRAGREHREPRGARTRPGSRPPAPVARSSHGHRSRQHLSGRGGYECVALRRRGGAGGAGPGPRARSARLDVHHSRGRAG